MQLYPYQERVKELIQSGKSVILQAPTGAGKTRAALAPFIEAFFDFPVEQFPKKCIYSVPMRVLANQFETEYRDLAASYYRKHRRQINVTVQTGDRPEDPQLEGDLIFATIDQTLSNFLCIPYALGNSRANINAGAIAAAYLVFDEFHLYDPKAALPTTLHMLRMLKGITPFLLMTATFSTTMLAQLAAELEAVIVPATEAERTTLQAIPSQQKERVYRTVNNVLTAEAVLAQHPERGRSIAICNTVQRAQDLFEAINRLKPPGVEVILLHSRFYQEHRQAKEEWLRREFGKDKAAYKVESAILVATQVVEVGLDITCDVLHTELAPANAILQRAGRCARYQDEKGIVYLYRLPLDKQGQVNYYPYHDHGQKEICESTWQAFEKRDLPGSQNLEGPGSLDFMAEQAIVSKIHGPTDAALLQQLQDDRFYHRQMMSLAMGYQERGLARELIREVNSRNIIVHPDPDSYAKSPWNLESFSLFTGSVYGAFKDLDALAEEIGHNGWVMRRLDRYESDEEWSGKEISYAWKRVYEQSALEGALMIAVHPRLATYDEERGLRLGVESAEDWTVQERKKKPRLDEGPYTYQQETYQEHIAGLYKTYEHPFYEKGHQRQALHGEMTYAFARVEQRFGLPGGSLDRAARFIIAGHDLGKLGQSWQNWAHRWQQTVNRVRPATEMLAHTDYDASDEQKKLQRKLGLRPPHAAEGAFSLLELTWEFANDVSLHAAINTAIARHHSTRHTGSVKDFKVDSHGSVALKEAFVQVGLADLALDTVQWTFEAGEELLEEMVEPVKTKQVLLYFLLVRILRLADQRSQQHSL